MTAPKMHENEFEINEALVHQLLQSQFKPWANLPLSRVKSDGTDHAIYRLGEKMCVRLPRLDDEHDQIVKEHRWLPYLAPHLPLHIPVPLGKGVPEGNYPAFWSIYSWLEGNNAAREPIKNLEQAAIELARFIKALQSIDASGGPVSRRAGPLTNQDQETQEALKALVGVIDTKAASDMWQQCLQAPQWDKKPVWLHSDLLPGNLLVTNDKLVGVIDFGLLGIGDPACDLLPAWALFSGKSRQVFKDELGVDEATWRRGQGWALSIGLIILPYYLHTNPGLVAVGRRLISEVLADE